MSGERGSNTGIGMFVLSKEELELKRKIDAAYFFFNFLPVSVASGLTVKYFIHTGRFKPKRPGLVYGGVLVVSYITSKFLAFRECAKQMAENFPDGVFAQTRHLTRDQLLEYLKKRDLEQAKAKLEAAGMDVKPLDDSQPSESNITTSFADITGEPQSQPSPVVKKTYADLRREQSGGLQSPKPSTLSPPLNKGSPDGLQIHDIAEDPLSKPRRKRENKYGDEME